MTVVRQATATDVPTLLDLMAEFYGESSYPLDRAWAAQACFQFINRSVWTFA